MHREKLLPLVEVGSRAFEELCRDVLVQAFPDVVRAALKRAQGLRQFGVDVEGFNEHQDPAVVLSAKCYRAINGWDFRLWVDEFLEHVDGHWAGKGVRDFVLAVAVTCNDDDMNAAARALVSRLGEKGIKFHLWDAHAISRYAGADPSIVDRYFNRYWVEAISAAPGATSASDGAARLSPDPALSAAADLLREAMRQIGSGVAELLDDAMGELLETALGAARAGRPGKLRGWLSKARNDTALWSSMAAPTKAKALRAEAMILLWEGRRDVAAILDEADGLAQSPDRSARALLTRSERGPQSALELLDYPRAVRERELKAALLIEVGRPAASLAYLADLPAAEITSEMLRVRAIASFMTGARDDALRDAKAAAHRAPGEIAPALTLATVRVLSALAPGVRPQFVTAPEPINPGLVLATGAARAHLDDALRDFDQLLLATEQPFREGIELWKLAVLLLHPGRATEASIFAGSLAERDPVDPLVVCWTMNYGLLRKPGRIRKALGDIVRRGSGTPTHLVVLALLSAGIDHPERGAGIIRRHRALFPEAADFLEGWCTRFGDGPEGGPVDYPSAVRIFLRDEDAEPLLTLLDRTDVLGEDVFSAAELLAAHSAWKDLDRLRPKLLAFGTERASELAAVSALRNGKPSECLSILSEAEAVSDERRLPRRLVHLRIEANEDLGEHRPIIADLLSIRRDGDDPRVDRRLLDAYVRIGALPEVRAEAEQSLASGRLDAEQALRIAYVLRVHDPPTARRALEIVTEAGVSAREAGPVLSLAVTLGMSAVRDRMLSSLATRPANGVRLVEFASTDEMVAFAQEAAREHRERFEGWLRGRLPAPVAFAGDLRTYASLFLAEPEFRSTAAGDPFPALLRSGAARPPARPMASGRAGLRLDLSALLLAERLNILDDVERAFAVQVPDSAAEALVEMEAACPSADRDVVEGCRAALAEGRSVLRIGMPPSDAVSVDGSGPGTLDGAVVGALLAAAVAAGEFDREQVGGALAALGLSDGPRSEELVEAAIVSPLSLSRLAGAGVLEPVARGTRLWLSGADAERCRRDLLDVDAATALRERIGDLRAKLAHKLKTGAWTSFRRKAEEVASDVAAPPAHLRCLFETLSPQAARAESFWIEDRALSHGRADGALDVVDILSELEARGSVDAARRAALSRHLRRIGYAFLPLSASEVQAWIEEAPVDDAGLVETPALAEIRRWIACDIAALAHVDVPVVEPGPDGPLPGEMRRLLDVGGLARSVLGGIWKGGAGVDEKRARSTWAWTCLRADRLRGLPVDADPSSRRRYIALNVVHALDLPLVAGLMGDEFPDAHDFLDWLLAEVVFPLVEADPGVGDEMDNLLADTLVQVLRRDFGMDPPSRAHLRNLLVNRIGEFLNLLPSDWRERLVRRVEVTEPMSRREVMSVTFGDGVEVAVSALADALAAASAGSPADGSVTLPLMNGGDGSIEIDLAQPDTPLIVAGSSRIRLNAVHATLLHPDVTVRRGGLLSSPLADPAGTIRVDDLIALAGIDDAQDRLRRSKELLDRDFHRRLLGCAERVRAQGVLSLDDIALPGPEAIRGYLRLGSDMGNAGFMADAAQALEADLGTHVAALRLAGSPMSLPDDLVVRWGTTQEGRVEAPDARSTSPLLRLLGMRALARVGADAALMSDAAGALVSSLAEHGRFFVAVVRHATASASRMNGWRELSDHVRVSFLWIFADQVTQALASPGLALDEVAAWIEDRTSFVRSVSDGPTSIWARRLTNGLTSRGFAGIVVAAALRDGCLTHLPQEVVASFAGSCGYIGDAGWTAFIDIVPAPVPAPSACWAARDTLAPMVEVGWMAAGHPFAGRSDDDMATRLLDAPATTDIGRLSPALLSLVDARRVGPEVLARMREVVDEGVWERESEPDTGALQRALAVRAAVLARSGDVVTMHDALATLAARAAGRWPNGSFRPGRDRGRAIIALTILIDAAFSHADALERPRPERMRVFADAVGRIGAAWPGAGRTALHQLDAVVRRLDVESACEMWPVLLDLRRKV